MNITQTLESLSILTDSDALFCELRALISKNFTKTLANKDKIISFYEESEIPQRKCFLKFIKKLYEKQGNELDVTFAKYKTIKLSLVQRNALTNIYNIDIEFLYGEMIFTLNNTPRAFASYILQNFKDNESKFDEKNHKFSLKIKKDRLLLHHNYIFSIISIIIVCHFFLFIKIDLLYFFLSRISPIRIHCPIPAFTTDC